LLCVVGGSELPTHNMSFEVDDHDVAMFGDVLSYPDHLTDLHLEPGFLEHLSSGCVAKRLARVHLASGDRPEASARLVTPLHQEQAVVVDQHHSHADHR
jgi:hypothetical protein